MSNGEDSSLPTGTPWTIEQRRSLTEERRDFNRYMWQVPVATLAIVGLVLNSSARIWSYGSPPSAVLVRLLFIVCALICIYSLLLLGRLHHRREAREARLHALEEKVSPEFSAVVDVNKDQVKVANKQSWVIISFFGFVRTTVLGMAVLLLIAILFGVLACKPDWLLLVASAAHQMAS